MEITVGMKGEVGTTVEREDTALEVGSGSLLVYATPCMVALMEGAACAAIEKLFPMPQVPAGEILTNLRHAQAVSAALESITAALEAMEYGATPDIVLTESETAMAALGELSGRSIREDVTNRIFQRFCVGK